MRNLCSVQETQDDEEKSSAAEPAVDTSPEEPVQVLTLPLWQCQRDDFRLHMQLMVEDTPR